MDLDQIYKSGISTSHVAGLQAVFNAGLEHAAAAFLAAATAPVEAPAVEVPPIDPVV